MRKVQYTGLSWIQKRLMKGNENPALLKTISIIFCYLSGVLLCLHVVFIESEENQVTLVDYKYSEFFSLFVVKAEYFR